MSHFRDIITFKIIRNNGFDWKYILNITTLVQDAEFADYTEPVLWSVRKILYLVYGRYLQDSPQPNLNGNIPIWLGDMGYKTEEYTQILDDYDRVEYYKGWLNQVLKGINT